MKKQVTAVLGEVIDITEEDLVFTNEQLTKLEELRRNSRTNGAIQLKEFPRKKKRAYVEKESSYTEKLKVGTSVRVTEQNHTFIGFITKVHPDRWCPKFDIETPAGILKEVDYRQVQYRKVENYTGVYIPEILKTMTTQHLLAELKRIRILENTDTDWATVTDSDGETSFKRITPYYSHQIKAELSTRPHIPTKAERKAMINHGKRNKQSEKYEQKMKKIKKAKN